MRAPARLHWSWNRLSPKWRLSLALPDCEIELPPLPEKTEPPLLVAAPQHDFHLEIDPPPGPPIELLRQMTPSPPPPPQPPIPTPQLPPAPSMRELTLVVRSTVDQYQREAALEASGGDTTEEGDSQAAPGGPCVVFLIDNAATKGERRWLHQVLMRRATRLSETQLFYVIAFDELTHRMFSDHSPEPRPLPVTNGNLEQTAAWLGELRPGSSGALSAAKWAGTHAWQHQPESVVLVTSGRQPHRGLAAHLRNANRDATGQPRVPLHVLSLRRDAATQLRRLARENGGVCEFVRGRSNATFAARAD